MFYVLPLEPLEERYTKQWYDWFKTKVPLNTDLKYIDGETLGDTVEVGTVLDAAGTNYWKMTQMSKVARLFKERKIKDGDVFFTMDLWHPGLETIPYMAQLYGLKVKVYGFLHAGSYTSFDFAEPMTSWAKFFEAGWAQFVDGIFVGTEYHKGKFFRNRLLTPDAQENKALRDKIHVVGNPIEPPTGKQIPFSQREKLIVFSNRFDAEKGVSHFLKLMNELWKQRKDFKVIFTTSRPEFRSNSPELLQALEDSDFDYEIKAGLSKQQYYDILGRCKLFVSTTLEENFGYCLVESVMMGVIPLVVNRYSHIELVSRFFRFSTDNEFKLKANLFLDRTTELQNMPDMTRYEDSILRMYRIMGVTDA